MNPNLCFECHAGIFKAYRETGMANSFAHPRPENTVEDYTNHNRFYHAPSNTYFEMIRRGGDYFQLRYQIGYADPLLWYQLDLTAHDPGAFEKALALDPGMAEAHDGLGELLAGSGDLARAESQFREA